MIRIGQGIDIHEFSTSSADNKKLMLGGIEVPYFKGLKGHSDADVLLHALVDALLGALALGDIGDHFPPSDKKWQGASSKIFVEYTKNILQLNHATINNIDATLLLEEPKLFNFKNEIKKSIANLLEIELNQVNIKASTAEKLGFIGRKEGIYASVIATLIIKNND